MASCSRFSLSSCLIVLISLQLPPEGSGKVGKRNLVMLGTKAELHCPLSVWMAPESVEVKWLRTPESQISQAVHVYRNGQDLYGEQMPQYKGRTALVKDNQEDSFILEIYNVRLEDQGEYYCQIQAGSLSKNASVKMDVAALGLDPYIHMENYEAGQIQLVCRSLGWFPKPQVQWTDAHGEILPSETQYLDKEGLFQMEASVTVRDGSSGNMTCSIWNSALGQEKRTTLFIRAFPSLYVTPSAVGLAVILPILGLFIALGIYIIWKQRRSREKLLYQQVVEIENLLSDHGKEKGRLHKGLKKYRAELKLKRTAADAGWRRARLHLVDVTLDPDTAHPKLLLSEDLRSVKLGDKRQAVPDNPKRFNFVVSVLGSPTFTSGCHYWEVCVGNKTKWILGVCSESVSRKGKITATPSNGHWLLRQSGMNEYEALTSPQTYFRLKESPRRVGVFLDYEGGFVSFYNATNKSHIYTFVHSFSGPLRPFFEPCLHDEGKNVAPLIICSGSQNSEEFIYSNLSPETSKEEKQTLGIGNGKIPTKTDQAPNLYPLQDIVSSWPSDITPALQGLRAPFF
ncbi:erythroid membrane-associated protein isoform X1 [Antechinus flavipes]|uniref:erythroid membrane-associated protein isoform X1 n=1 Tax=Antechinus flavipes TaxID=38775 RepID=UPI0022361A63|nr:erythroid membrane-associated protein isoform X1 [Antechinus flavipes]XP_051843900.1 erythroid membrane-associated protein isoform X1 [Antechinus flavipes]